MSQYFLNHMSLLEETLMPKLTDLIMQQKLIKKYISHVDVSSFSLKPNLANLKTEVDKLDIDKLTPVSNDLAKLIYVVKIDVIKKTEHNKLVSKVNNIHTTGFALKTTYDADKSDLEKKISVADKKIPDKVI